MIEIKLYEASCTHVWNDFVLYAKNGHFMFCRDYMDYHFDRFKDHSLMFFNEGELVALLPANLGGDTLYSHQGLTFGGIISSRAMTMPLMIKIFMKLIEYLKVSKIKKLIYKHLPYIYSACPSQEDLYALYNIGAKLFRVDVSSTINLRNKLEFTSRRKRGINKALKANLKIITSHNFEGFYEILSHRLQTRHSSNPTHSLLELKLLADRFPENIALHTTVDQKGCIYAGVLVFKMNGWAHAQYIVSSENGRNMGALDLLFYELINNAYKQLEFFDFGISTEEQGQILNDGLITQKEEFGARSIVHQFFEVTI